MKRVDPKTSLLEHSEAKLRLYGRYLSVYLTVLHRAGFAKRILIFDLFCGEGIYENQVKGSPIIALECIRDHYYANQQVIPDMTVWLNDVGRSELEDAYKVDRVKRLSAHIAVPSNVNVLYFRDEYRDILPRAIALVEETEASKALFFLDPFAYKLIKLADIRRILQIGNTEVLWWLPIAQMYRFAGSVMQNQFAGGDPLREFLEELFGPEVPPFRSALDFVEQLRERFRECLRDMNTYVDRFLLERDATNVYALFFFTRNRTGFEKMVETKWRIDQEHGKGFARDSTLSLFSEVELSGYQQKVKAYVLGAECRTNEELYEFGLEHGFLPTHTRGVLDAIGETDGELDIHPLDGKPVKGYYLGNRTRRVGIALRAKGR